MARCGIDDDRVERNSSSCGVSILKSSVATLLKLLLLHFASRPGHLVLRCVATWSTWSLSLCVVVLEAMTAREADPVADPEGVLRLPGHQPSWHGAAGSREVEVDSARRV